MQLLADLSAEALYQARTIGELGNIAAGIALLVLVYEVVRPRPRRRAWWRR